MKKYNPEKQIDIKFTIQGNETDPSFETLNSIIAEIQTTLKERFTDKEYWMVTTSIGKRMSRHIKLNFDLYGISYRVPQEVKYYKKGDAHIYTCEKIKAYGSSLNSPEEAYTELQRDIDVWLKYHKNNGTLEDQIDSIVNPEILHLFKVYEKE